MASKLHILLLCAFAALGLLCASCSKVSGDPESPAAGESQGVAQLELCEHSGLIHHPAVEATATGCGNVEYWECSCCGKVFSDAEASHPLEGYIYIMPTNFLKDISPLESLKGCQTKGTITTGELIVDFVSLAADVASMGVAIADLADGVKNVQKAYDKLAEKEEKNQEEVARMQEYMNQISSGINKAVSTVNNMYGTLEEMNDKVDEICADIVVLNESLNTLLEEIKSLEYDFRLQSIMDNRQSLISTLDRPSRDAYSVLLEYLGEAREAFGSCATKSDTLSVLLEYNSQQRSVLKSWAELEGPHLSSAFKLLSTFSDISYNSSETFPSILECYTNRHFAWEHYGYEFRRDLLLKDVFVMSLSYNLARLHYSISEDIDPKWGKFRSQELDSLYVRGQRAYSLDSLKMADGYKQYRYCYATGKKYKLNVGYIDTDQLLDILNDVGAVKCPDPISLDGLYSTFVNRDNAVTRMDLESMEQYYYGENQTVQSVYFSESDGGMAFEDPADNLKKYLITPYMDKDPLYCVGLSDYFDIFINSHYPNENTDFFKGECVGPYSDYSTPSDKALFVFPLYCDE